MNRMEMMRLIEREQEAELSLFARKNVAYAYSEADALENFKKGAEALNLDPMKYLMTLVSKHFLALAKCDATSLQLVDEYARDIRLYMLLLMALVKELKSSPHNQARKAL